MNETSEILEKILNKTINFIGYTFRTRQEVINRLDQYLKKEDITEEDKNYIHENVLERIEAAGLLNDEFYAKTYIEGKIRSSKPVSKKSITAFLYKKGINKNIIEKMMDIYPQEEEEKQIRELAIKKRKIIKDEDQKIVRQKLTRFLINKGFTPSVVIDVVNNLDK